MMNRKQEIILEYVIEQLECGEKSNYSEKSDVDKVGISKMFIDTWILPRLRSVLINDMFDLEETVRYL